MKLDMRLKKEEVKRVSYCTPCIMRNDDGQLLVAIPTPNEIIYLQPDGHITWDLIRDASYEFVRNLEPGESFTVTI